MSVPAPVGAFKSGGALITPNRQTILKIDTPSYSNIIPTYFLEYEFDKIATQKANYQENTTFIPEVGWALTPFQVGAYNKYETTNAALNVITPANSNVTLASGSVATTGFLEVNNQKANTDLPGVLLGTNQQTSGDVFLFKSVSSNATDTFDLNLSADQSAFPAPDSANDLVTLDRVLISTFNHDPRFGIHFRFKLLGTATQNPQRVFRLYFTGIPTYLQTDPYPGTGQYCLALQGDGTATLYEGQNFEWVYRGNFNWVFPGNSIAGSHDIWIASDCQIDQFGNYYGSFISFRFGVSNQPFAMSSQGVSQNVAPSMFTRYPVVQQTPTQPTFSPVRLDIRRDQKCRFQISTSAYQPSGSVVGNVFTIPFVPYGTNSAQDFRVEYYGAIPIGTAMSVTLVDSKGNAQTPTTSAVTLTGGYQSFTLTQSPGHPPDQTYQYQLNLTASDQSLTPIINRVRLVRPGEVILSTPGTPGYPPITTITDPQKLEMVSWSGASTDMSQESWAMRIADLGSTLKATLGTRAQMNGQLSVVVTDPASSGSNTFTSILWNGIVLSAPFTRIGGKRQMGLQSGIPAAFPAPDWGRYEMKATGAWYRLYKQLSPQYINFAVNANGTADIGGNPQPWKVTDIIRWLLTTGAGYAATMIAIPDLPIQYFGDPKTPLYVEAKTQVGPLVAQLARDYLGGWIVFCPNSTNGGNPLTDTNGCWRLIMPPSSQYTDPDTGLPAFNNLAQFWTGSMPATTTEPPILALAMSPASWPSTAVDNIGTGQKLVNTFIQHGTWHAEIIPPEFNALTVTGVGIGTSLTATTDGSNQTTMTQRIINPVSAWFAPNQAIPPDPSNPDYIGEIREAYYSDPGLTSQGLVNFTARRIFDIAGHAQIRASFEAPLVFVTDTTDPYQIRPRMLRYGDPVLIMNNLTGVASQWFISSVNGTYEFKRGGDSKQTVAIEVFAPSYDASMTPWVGDPTN
jgi:hypothetical protein